MTAHDSSNWKIAGGHRPPLLCSCCWSTSKLSLLVSFSALTATLGRSKGSIHVAYLRCIEHPFRVGLVVIQGDLLPPTFYPCPVQPEHLMQHASLKLLATSLEEDTPSTEAGMKPRAVNGPFHQLENVVDISESFFPRFYRKTAPLGTVSDSR